MNIRVKITRDGSGRIETLDMEQYLIGVVASEMSDAWPLEALKAQAVAARTYAAARLSPGRPYDVDDTTKYQAYRKPKKPLPNVERAVRETAGIVAVYAGRFASTVYSASNGGVTRSAKERWGSNIPYLPHRDDPWNKASGYPRYGHSVGMSQRGAQWAANHGVGFREILAFYYPGTKLVENYGKAVEKPPEPPQTKPEPIPITVGIGDGGATVERLQRELNERKQKVGIDGIFGPETLKAVKAFQKAHGLAQDGIVGPKTWAALLA